MSTIQAEAPATTVVGPISRSRTRKITLVQLVAATYLMVAGGPYGLEDIVGRAGYGGAILILLVTPLLWSVPTALDGQRALERLAGVGGILRMGEACPGTVLGLPGGVALAGRQHLRHGDLSDALHPLPDAPVAGARVRGPSRRSSVSR